MSNATAGLEDGSAVIGHEEGRGIQRVEDGEVEEDHGNEKAELGSSCGKEEGRDHGLPLLSAFLHPESQVNYQFADKNCTHEDSSASSAEKLEDHVDGKTSADVTLGENSPAHGTSFEANLAAYGSSERVLENVGPYGTSGAHTISHGHSWGQVHEGSPPHTALRQKANSNLGMTGQQTGRYPHEIVPPSGNLERHGYAKTMEAGGHAYDFSENGDVRLTANDMTTQSNTIVYNDNELGGNAQSNTIVYNELGGGGEDLKIELNHIAINTEAPSVMNYSMKTGSFLSSSSFYTSLSGSLKNVRLSLRLGGALFSLLALSVMISTSEKRVAAGSTFYVRFSDYQAYNYLIALNLLSFLYSSGQLILCAQGRNVSVLSSPIKWGALVYICDQMLAFLMVSCSSSAATASELSRHGLHNIWPPACSTWKLSFFCSKADVAVVMSFLSSLFLVLSSFASGYHLSNLLAE